MTLKILCFVSQNQRSEKRIPFQQIPLESGIMRVGLSDSFLH